MNASAGRGDEGISRELLMGRAAMVMNMVGLADGEAGDMAGKTVAGDKQQVHMRLVGLGDKQVLVVEREEASRVEQPVEGGEEAQRMMRSMRSFIDRLDPPMDEARSRAAFARLMRKLREQQDTELRWRWVRRVATALAAAAGAGAVRMLSR
jgi:hypothetical protein